AGFDPEYLYSRPGPVPDLVGGLEGGVRGLRVGTSPDLLVPQPEPEVRAAYEATLRRLEQLGARLVSVRMPHHEMVFRTTMGVFAIEGGVGLDALIGDRPRVFGPQVQRIFEITRAPDVATAVHTQQRRQLVARDYQAAFVEAHVLVAPGAPMPAPRRAPAPRDRRRGRGGGPRALPAARPRPPRAPHRRAPRRRCTRRWVRSRRSCAATRRWRRRARPGDGKPQASDTPNRPPAVRR